MSGARLKHAALTATPNVGDHAGPSMPALRATDVNVAHALGHAFLQAIGIVHHTSPQDESDLRGASRLSRAGVAGPLFISGGQPEQMLKFLDVNPELTGAKALSRERGS